MDVWHWTSLVVLLGYAGLVSIPDAYYQAAKIDGARPWAVFRYIQLPKLKRVLTIAILLRFMDSFMIYTEVVVLTGGGPGNSTTFLSIDLVQDRARPVRPRAGGGHVAHLLPDHPAASWIFYTLMMRDEAQVMRKRYARADRLHRLPDAADLLAAQHVVQDHQRDPRRLHRSSRTNSRSTTTARSSPTRPGTGYINSLTYVVINTVISVAVALPAAYAFSRYRFLGDKHLFFWLLTNRMAPPAVFALPFLQLYSAVGLFDTHLAVALAHTLFNIPLAVWILEGFMSGVPKELDETAYVDGYSFPRFFFKIFLPTIAAGIGVAAFFCFMFSWVELLLAKNADLGGGQADRRRHDQDRQHLRL